MAQRQRIVHSIPPTFDDRSRVLVLGTMPSPASRELGFNYGHPRNRFWKVLSQLAGEPLPATNERKRDFCLRHHIALWDVLAQCDIEGASDASIAGAVPNRLTRITETAPIEAVFCTGAKSYELYCRLCADDVGIPAVKLPSTSPANAACSLERLLREYAAVFEHERPFCPPVLDVPDVVALEQAIAAAGTPLAELMDRAGAAVAWRVQQILDEPPGMRELQGMREFSDGSCGEGRGSMAVGPRAELPAGGATGPVDARRPGGPVAVLCGNGNNGGDGWDAAALLAHAGIEVRALTAKAPDAIKAQPARDAALAAYDQLVAHGSSILVDDGSAKAHGDALDAIAGSRVVVDAVMGTGTAKSLRQPFLDWVEAANGHRDSSVVLAVDVPSGIDARTGQSTGPCVHADETLTMMVGKPGLVAPECGRVSIAPLAYIEPLLESVSEFQESVLVHG